MEQNVPSEDFFLIEIYKDFVKQFTDGDHRSNQSYQFETRHCETKIAPKEDFNKPIF
jgi:hypothetical protein